MAVYSDHLTFDLSVKIFLFTIPAFDSLWNRKIDAHRYEEIEEKKKTRMIGVGNCFNIILLMLSLIRGNVR